MTMNCERCGVEIERRNSRQKYCAKCSCERDRIERPQAERERRREANRRYYAKHKAEKQKEYVAGAGCTKWRTCVYGMGSQDACRNGLCRYNEKTGKCKIIEVDGRKTVAPTKNCVFYKRKKRNDAS